VNPRAKSICTGIAAFALGGILTSFFLPRREQADKEKQESKAEKSRLKRSPNGETIVAFDAETQKRIGLKVESPAATQWQPELNGYGRVLDPAPLAALMTDLAQAQVAAETSRREFERLRTLAAGNNASARALQAADATATRDRLLAESLRTRTMLEWGKAIPERDDPPAFVKSLTTGERTLVRVDLPGGERRSSAPLSARLVPLGDNGQPVTGEFFDTAPAVDPQTQGQGFLFLIAGRPPGFSPNAAVTGYLKIAGEPLSGVIVPGPAVIRHEGRAWVYLQTGEQEFTRREILLDRPAENGWFLASGVTDKDRIVVNGAQAILSGELSASSFVSGTRD